MYRSQFHTSRALSPMGYNVRRRTKSLAVEEWHRRRESNSAQSVVVCMRCEVNAAEIRKSIEKSGVTWRESVSHSARLSGKIERRSDSARTAR